MVRKAFVALGAVLLAGCQTAAERFQPVPRAIAAADVRVIEQRVAFQLREPESARFLPPRAVTISDGSVIICGAVNSRNVFGGMTDWVPYVGSWPAGGDVNQFRVTVAQNGQQGVVLINTCADFGIGTRM
jgi:hypothetical protein